LRRRLVAQGDGSGPKINLAFQKVGKTLAEFPSDVASKVHPNDWTESLLKAFSTQLTAGLKRSTRAKGALQGAFNKAVARGFRVRLRASSVHHSACFRDIGYVAPVGDRRPGVLGRIWRGRSSGRYAGLLHHGGVALLDMTDLSRVFCCMVAVSLYGICSQEITVLLLPAPGDDLEAWRSYQRMSQLSSVSSGPSTRTSEGRSLHYHPQ
jgi:hypothetical protein